MQTFDQPHGDWSQWRGGAQRWGYQSMPGEIADPAIASKYRLGGAISPEQTLICDDRLILSPSGKLHAYTLDSQHLWSLDYGLDSSLLGCWDLDGNGSLELIAAQGISNSTISIIDVRSGDMLWTSPTQAGRIGSVKIVPLDGDSLPEMIWHPAASSQVLVYTFKNNSASPTLLWQVELSDYVSDPFSFSPFVIGDFAMNGKPQIIIGGGRGQKPIIVLDAASGREIARTHIENANLESGGFGQLLMLTNLDSDTNPELLQIGDWVSGQSYMFQGIAVASFEQTLSVDAIISSEGRRTHYVDGSIRDFDGDHVNDILVSQYTPETQKHVTVLLDSQDLSVKSWLNDFFVLAVIESRGEPLIIGIRQARVEAPGPIGQLETLRYDNGELKPAGWSAETSALVTISRRVFSSSDIDNPGPAALTIENKGVLLYKDSDRNGRFDQLLLAAVPEGEVLYKYADEAGSSLKVLAASEKWVVVGLDSGEVIVLDNRLQKHNRIEIGGFYRNETGNYHTTDVAAISDLDNDDQNEILAVTSQTKITRLDTGETLWQNGIFQELLVVSGKDEQRLVVRGLTDNHPSVSLISGSESVVWTHVFEDFSLNTQDQSVIRGYSAGHFNKDDIVDIVVSIGGDDLHQKHLYALDGSNGKQLWQSPYGTYIDATMAIWDFNRDGFDDVVYNHDVHKGIVTSGQNGAQLSPGVILNAYKHLNIVDYSGALSVVTAKPGQTGLLNSEDDAHMALLQFAEGANTTSQKWDIPQQVLDDERLSMGAVVQLNEELLVVCVGSQRGLLETRRISDGTTVWSVSLEHGMLLPTAQTVNNPLSDVIALDVNGNGQTDFVVGDSTGWLYALEGITGNIIWSYNLGAAAGDPIAGDVDDDGFSEIVVPAADGYLYIIDQG